MTTTFAPEIETAPAEPTTPIKPSEALRLGRLTRPVRILHRRLEGQFGACAIGAIQVGYGYGGPMYGDGDSENLDVVTDALGGRAVFDEVWLRNDDGWSDDQIVSSRKPRPVTAQGPRREPGLREPVWHHSKDAPPEHFCEDCDALLECIDALAKLLDVTSRDKHVSHWNVSAALVPYDECPLDACVNVRAALAASDTPSEGAG